MTQAENTTVEFVDLLNFADYEILNEYPFTIRRKDNQYVVKESFNSRGYIKVNLNCKLYLKHRLIAEQFLPNPNNLSDVDHINRNRSDNHLSNLRWVSHSKNIMNCTAYHGIPARYVDEISPEALVVDYYDNKHGRHYFTDYYYYEGVFYYDNDMNYRVLNINLLRNEAQYVNMNDTEGKRVKVFVARFLEQHDMT